MKQIVILFVMILFVTASSDLLKSISKFADEGDQSSKFAKSKVSPFSEEESEDYDEDDTNVSKKISQNSQSGEDDDEVDVMAQLKSYQQKLSTNKDVKPPQPQKKQVPVISESESEYDDEDDSGNMWSRGISKKLAQTESKPFVLPLQNAKEQIKNDFNQFTSLKMPEIQQRPQENKIQDKSEKVQDDSGKEHSADFEKMKQAQLEKYSKRFHLDEPKESKSMYEDDSLKEFMPKINFQPINIQETKTSQQIQQNPEKNKENKYKEPESDSDEDDQVETVQIKTNNSQSNKSNNNNKIQNDLSTQTEFDFFSQNKQKQKSNKKNQKVQQQESYEDDETVDDEESDDEDENYVLQVKKNKKQQEDKEELKRKEKQKQQQEEEEEEQRKVILKKQKEQEEIRKKIEEEELLQEISKQQKTKRNQDEDQIPQQKKSKKQKKQLSLEEFQQSLKLNEEIPQLTSFAQKEAKEKTIMEQKTFSLIKDTPQQTQEQKVFKLQAIPKKQQQLIQEEEEEEEETDSESDDDQELEVPKSINCFESKNKFIQQICQLCQTKVAYQVNQQNWQKIGINDGFRYLLTIEFRKSFEPLIEFTFKSIGEIGSYYLSFKDHTVCLSAENLTKMTNVDKVLKHFTGNSLAAYNSPVEIPAKSQPINFLLSAEYDSLLNGFSCRRFQIAIKTDLKYKLSKKNDINVKQIIFYKNKLKLKYIGLIQINGIVHQASLDQEEGGEATNLIVTQLNLPKEQGVIAGLVDKYIDNNFMNEMLEKSEQMTADLQIQTHIKNDDIGLTFNLRKRKGK